MDALLLRAILAMDAYNQGYGAGITEVGSQIGSATRVHGSSMLRDAEGKRLDHGIGFYAAAYQLADGSKIISYRGTDNAGASIDPVNGGSDTLNGYGVGAGSPYAPQAGTPNELLGRIQPLGARA